MATYLNPDISKEGILAVGDNILYTCPYKYTASFGVLRFSSPDAYDISIRIERAEPASTITYYSFTLDAGDAMLDGNSYRLSYNDQIIVTTNVATVTYSYIGQVYPIVPKQP